MDPRNVVMLVGHLTADPDLRYTPQGTPIAVFGLAVNSRSHKGGGEFEDVLDGFFDCSLIGGTALTFVEGFKKGAGVQITGSLHQSKFTPKGTDRKISKIEVRARTVAPILAPVRKEDWGTRPQSAQSEPATEQVPQPA
ncbi:MAG: single-stranded DNA-binding protein [Actinomycetota bacterium]